jgi:hypothetical protein
LTLVQLPASGGRDGDEVVDAAVWVCNTALDELRRQVASDNPERGDLMAALTEHMSALLSLQAGFQREQTVQRVHAHYTQLFSPGGMVRAVHCTTPAACVM